MTSQSKMPRHETTKLEALFNNVYSAAYRLRSNDPKGLDGLIFWQPIKSATNQYNDHRATWIKLEWYDELKKLSEYDEFGRLLPLEHFMKQPANLYDKGYATIRTILQVALNVGQQHGCLPSGNEHYEMLRNKSLVYKNIDLFISEEDNRKLSELLDFNTIQQINAYLISAINEQEVKK